MKILVEVLHPAHVNFFKNLIPNLSNNNFEIHITYRDRGILKGILNSTFGDIPTTKIGKHHSSLLGKFFGTIDRLYDLLVFINKYKPKICISNGLFLSICCKFKGIPSIVISDDFEYKLTYYLAKFFASDLLIPSSINDTGQNLIFFSGFKELSYLHPNYFEPDKTILKHYNIKPRGYVFVRLVSSVSLNYKSNRGFILALLLINSIRKHKHKILLSLENKSYVNLFSKSCIIIEEPVDIHSLMFFAEFTVSSGDSMARESCLLGTPSIYTGGRKMAVNQELVKHGFMKEVNSNYDAAKALSEFMDNNTRDRFRLRINQLIENEWEDPTEIMHRMVLSYMQ